jgi:hypothetical protein
MSRRNSIPRGKVRIRRDSGTKLDYYNKIVSKSILIHQNPVTGLFAASSETDHAWVRDNVYSIMSGKRNKLIYKFEPLLVILFIYQYNAIFMLNNFSRNF